MKKLNKFIQKYILERHQLKSTDELSALFISVFVFLHSVFVGLIFAPIQYKAGGLYLFYFTVAVSSISLISILILKFTKYTVFSRMFFIFSCNLMIYLNTVAVGLECGIQYFLAPAVSLPFLMFNFKTHLKYILISIAISFLFGSLIHLSNLHFIKTVILSQQITDTYGFVSSFLSLSLVSFSTFYFQQLISLRDKEIESKNKTIFHNEKLASLGTLSSGIAHEINTPLTVILGSATQLKRSLETETLEKSECNQKLDRIIKMTNRVSKIIHSLKTYNRDESNSPLSEILLDQIIEEAITLHKSELENLEIKFNIKLQQMPSVLARESDLLQIFINLIANSIYSIRDQKNKWIQIEWIQNENEIICLYSDSGLAIDSKVATKIFDPFFTTKKVGEGTGLGLYISKNLIESMQGKLEFDLNANHPTFIITLKKYKKLYES